MHFPLQSSSISLVSPLMVKPSIAFFRKTTCFRVSNARPKTWIINVYMKLTPRIKFAQDLRAELKKFFSASVNFR